MVSPFIICAKEICMTKVLSKKNIIQKVAQVAGLTALSRVFGIAREILQSNFLGVGLVSDAFITAFKIPNFFRHIFAEGALSAAFVPQFVKMIHEKKQEEAASFMTVTLLFFEGTLILLSLYVFFNAEFVTKLLAGGFSSEQLAATAPYLKLLFPLIFFFSGTSLLSGALQAVNHFLIPAFGQPFFNIIYISSIFVCMAYKFTGYSLCFGILFAAGLQFVMHLVAYFLVGLRFGALTRNSWQQLKALLARFIPCLSGVSVNEINLLIDLQLSSYLPLGSVSLVYYAMRFVQIPLGIIGVALATVLFPHFSRVALYAKSRLSFYLLESTKLIIWLVAPTLLYLMFIAEKIFSILMLKNKATPENIYTAQLILIILASGLIFYCLNRILASIFYSLSDTKTPAKSTIIQAVVKVTGDFTGMYFFGVYGLAAATVASSIVLTTLHFIQLRRIHNFILYTRAYTDFFVRFALQLSAGAVVYLSGYYLFYTLLAHSSCFSFFALSYGYFLFTISLFAGSMLFLFFTRRLFGVKLYFLQGLGRTR